MSKGKKSSPRMESKLRFARAEVFADRQYTLLNKLNLQIVMEECNILKVAEFREFVESGELSAISGVGPRTYELAQDILRRATK